MSNDEVVKNVDRVDRVDRVDNVEAPGLAH